MLKKYKVVFLLLALFMLNACSSPSLQPRETALTIAGVLQAPIEPAITTAHFVISRGKHIIEKTVPVNKNEFDITLELPIGQWEVTVFLTDQTGVAHYQSMPQEVHITANKPNILELVLGPAASQINISIDLSNYIFQKQAMRARIYFNDEVFEIIRSDVNSPLATEIQLAPGSYEFKIELFTESFRATDKLGPGMWKILDIPANEFITIAWAPETEELQITGYLETMLPAPNNVTLKEISEGVLIEWEPILDQDLAGYLVFVQANPLERYELLTPTPCEETKFVHQITEQETAFHNRYIIAGISTGGRAGYYSQPQQLKAASW